MNLSAFTLVTLLAREDKILNFENISYRKWLGEMILYLITGSK